jgi:hypothetical protein
MSGKILFHLVLFGFEHLTEVDVGEGAAASGFLKRSNKLKVNP